MYYKLMKKIELDIESLRQAKISLEKVLKVYNEGCSNQDLCDIYADSCVKRFEYTFETAWKVMKKYFKLQYSKTEEDLTMNNLFRYMEAYGFTSSWIKWKEYYFQRNSTAHEYNFIKSRKLILIIPDFINEINFLLNKWDSL